MKIARSDLSENGGATRPATDLESIKPGRGGSRPARRTPRSPGRPSLERSGLIEKELLDGALREFVRAGYGGASVNRIVKELKISKTTFYSRFASKAELFKAIMARQVEALDPSALLGLHDGNIELSTGLRAYANRMLEASLEGGILEINRLIYSESHRFPELGSASAERTRIGIRQIAQFITTCAERDRVPVKDPEVIAEAFIYILRGWYVDILVGNITVSAVDRERWVERAVHALVAGRRDW